MKGAWGPGLVSMKGTCGAGLVGSINVWDLQEATVRKIGG